MIGFSFLKGIMTAETKGRIGIYALVCFLVVVLFFTVKYHSYKEENIELHNQIEAAQQEIKSANMQRDFAYFQLDKNKEMQAELIKERDRIKDKYANILEQNKDLKDDNISDKLVGILNDIQDKQE